MVPHLLAWKTVSKVNFTFVVSIQTLTLSITLSDSGNRNHPGGQKQVENGFGILGSPASEPLGNEQ